ncbi:MAG: UPF0175 family protein [Verrucomicrobia bacterium]|nr:UPF0175 family protein [Verrucomicrobiota bacterium]
MISKPDKVKEAEVHYPAGVETAAHMTKSEFERNLRLMAALKMFELGKLSSGKAAELAGMSRVQFLEACAQYGVSALNYPPEEFEQELTREQAAAKKLAK